MQHLSSDYGLFFTVNAIATIACRSFSGRLADRRGRWAVILPGLILLASGVSSFSLGLDFWEMIVAGVAMGIGTGLAYTGLTALAIDRAPLNERGSASAMFFGAFDVGYALGAVVSGVVADKAGLTAPFVVGGAVILVGFACSVICSREVLPPKAALRPD